MARYQALIGHFRVEGKIVKKNQVKIKSEEVSLMVGSAGTQLGS